MIIFKKLKYKNFLSTGNNDIEIDLDYSKRTLVVGTNGAGKCLRGDTNITVSFGATAAFTLKTDIKTICDFYADRPDMIGMCFVATRHGLKRIEAAAVTAKNSAVHAVTLSNGSKLWTSPDHLLACVDGTPVGNWVKVKDLAVGTLCHIRNGTAAITENILLDSKEDLYDLQVEEVHEFYANDVVSHNSLMLDALSFGLFGKPHRKINKNQLINSINGKNMAVEVSFSIGPNSYKIIRGVKPNIFEIWVNGELLNQESHSRDYQHVLETNILKLNHKSFHQVVVLGSSNFIPFMQLTSFHRREIIEDILDISIFSKMNILLKEETAKLKDCIKNIEYDFIILKEKIRLQRLHIDKLKEINSTNSNKLDDEILMMQEQITLLINENTNLIAAYNQHSAGANTKLNEIRSDREKLLSYRHSIKSNITSSSAEEEFYQNNREGPSCSQTIDESLRSEKIHKCNIKSNELKKGYAQLQTSLNALDAKYKEQEKVIAKLVQLNNKASNNNSLILNYEKRASELRQLKSQENSCDELGRATRELTDICSEYNLTSELKSKSIEDKLYADGISELLKDSGIKTKIIRQYLPAMNSLINNYLKTLDFFVSFELDENFNETIKSRHRDDFSYSSFSEGEKSRIDLSIMFAWRQIAKLKNSANTNLLILDEVFDSSLDTDGIDNLVKIMNTLDDQTCFYVITHKPDSFETLFDRKITASRKGNFTTYATETLKT